jgi:hypothetical protein
MKNANEELLEKARGVWQERLRKMNAEELAESKNEGSASAVATSPRRAANSTGKREKASVTTG